MIHWINILIVFRRLNDSFNIVESILAQLTSLHLIVCPTSASPGAVRDSVHAIVGYSFSLGLVNQASQKNLII
jgi:hypothetical protein